MPGMRHPSTRHRARPLFSTSQAPAFPRAISTLLRDCSPERNPLSARLRFYGTTPGALRKFHPRPATTGALPAKVASTAWQLPWQAEHQDSRAHARAWEPVLLALRGCGQEYFLFRSFTVAPKLFEGLLGDRRQLAGFRPLIRRVKTRAFHQRMKFLRQPPCLLSESVQRRV